MEAEAPNTQAGAQHPQGRPARVARRQRQNNSNSQQNNNNENTANNNSAGNNSDTTRNNQRSKKQTGKRAQKNSQPRQQKNSNAVAASVTETIQREMGNADARVDQTKAFYEAKVETLEQKVRNLDEYMDNHAEVEKHRRATRVGGTLAQEIAGWNFGYTVGYSKIGFSFHPSQLRLSWGDLILVFFISLFVGFIYTHQFPAPDYVSNFTGLGEYKGTSFCTELYQWLRGFHYTHPYYELLFLAIVPPIIMCYELAIYNYFTNNMKVPLKNRIRVLKVVGKPGNFFNVRTDDRDLGDIKHYQPHLALVQITLWRPHGKKKKYVKQVSRVWVSLEALSQLLSTQKVNPYRDIDTVQSAVERCMNRMTRLNVDKGWVFTKYGNVMVNTSVVAMHYYKHVRESTSDIWDF